MVASASHITNQDKRKQIDLLNHKAGKSLTASLIPSAIELAQKALTLSSDKTDFPNGYIKGIADSHINLGGSYLSLNKHEEALHHSLSAISFSALEDEPQQIAFSHRNAGYSYIRLGNYVKAIDHFQIVITVGQVNDTPLFMAWGSLGLSEVYGETGETEKAILQAELGLAIFQEVDDWYGHRNSLSNLCWLYNQQELYPQALQHGLAALELHPAENADFSIRIIASNLGETYQGLKDYTQAHHYFDLAQAVNSPIDYYTSSGLMTEKGRTYILQGDLIAAEKTLLEALRLGVLSKNPYCEYNAHSQLSQLFKLQGDFEASLTHFEQHHTVYTQYMGEENARRTRYLEISFNVELAEREAAIFRERNKELESRVAERTRELELLTVELERAYEQESELSELKSRIISTISHEFRSPLTVINSSVDILNTFYERLSEIKRGKLHKRIQTAIFYLTDLLQDIDLVDTVKRKNIRPNFKTQPINSFITTLTEELYLSLGTLENLTYHYNIDNSVLISADSSMLKQVMLDLLSNTIKYSAENSPINLTITHDPVFSIILQDIGIGIPKANIANIWDLFYRGSNIEERQGLGLGLFVARGLTEAMNGTISVQSVEDEGTTFTLTFPTAIVN